MDVMLSNRKGKKRIMNLTSYSQLLKTIKQKFPKTNKEDLYLTYMFGEDTNHEMPLINAEDIERIIVAKVQTIIFICRKKEKGQVSESLCESIQSKSILSQKEEKREIASMNSSAIDIQIQKGDKNSEDHQLNLQKSQVSTPEYKHEKISCSECKNSPIIGCRWKCKVCINENLCDQCYRELNNRFSQCNTSHGFYKIKNELFFKTLNYGEVISHFLSPNAQPEINKQPWLGWKQFQSKSGGFDELIARGRQKLIEILDQNAQSWEDEFNSQYANNK